MVKTCRGDRTPFSQTLRLLTDNKASSPEKRMPPRANAVMRSAFLFSLRKGGVLVTSLLPSVKVTLTNQSWQILLLHKYANQVLFFFFCSKNIKIHKKKKILMGPRLTYSWLLAGFEQSNSQTFKM